MLLDGFFTLVLLRVNIYDVHHCNYTPVIQYIIT